MSLMEDEGIRIVHCHRLLLGLIPTMILVSILISSASAAEVDEIGSRLYLKRCASCHGEAGEGVKSEYPSPLMGEDSVSQLAQYIDRWMPEDDPDECTGEDAENVARYIFDAFYSPAAQARNNPLRPVLSRMTARQFQNTTADLIGHFRPPAKGEEKEGLQGKYFKAGKPKGEPQVQRIDPEIRFKFSDDVALTEVMDATGFSARWTGSLHAPETGLYRFTVRTDHAARLWVNDSKIPLVDAWVRSGTDTDFSNTLQLIGGRPYPVILEFSSRIQGVENKFKGEKRGLDGFLELHWNLPKRPTELIPQNRLVSSRWPKVFVLNTTLPPDDRSDGYERGASVSKAWDEAATEAAIEMADYVTENLEELAHAKKVDDDYPFKVRRFCNDLTAQAFRAPLSAGQKKFYIDRQFARAPDLEAAVKRVALLTFKSPRFLYTDLIDPISDDYAIASALSFALWDSLPDKRLLEKAAADELNERDQIAAEAERMLDDYRGRAKLRDFLHQWLKVDETSELSKRTDLFPGFNTQLASDMRTSLDLFLEEIIADKNSSFHDLVLSRELYVNKRLGEFLGLVPPSDDSFKRLTTDESERAGVLTHPYIMAKFAYDDTTSPIHRGVFLARNVLGRGLRPPPEAVTPEPPELRPDLLTRERVALQTEAIACQSCHSLINPLGFTLEKFDAVGRVRDNEIGKPIDSTGAYLLPDGSSAEFAGARDLAEFLVEHQETHQAFAVQLHHYMVKQPINAYGVEMSESLTKSFTDSKLNLRRVATEIAINSALAKRGAHGADQSESVVAARRGFLWSCRHRNQHHTRNLLGFFKLCDCRKTNGRGR